MPPRATKPGETYIVGLRHDEARMEPCSGCGTRTLIAGVAWTQAVEGARDRGQHPSSVKAMCRQCLSRSGAVPLVGI